MRRVKRRFTKVWQPRPPWTWREEWHQAAPRTCLTHSRDEVLVTRAGRPLVAGVLDYVLRLYQHRGVTLQSATTEIDGDLCALYDRDQEWEVIKYRVDWLELVDNTREICWRIPMRDARKYSRETVTANGQAIAVPLKHYTKHERD